MTLEEIRAGIIRLLREGTDVENITGEDVTQAKRFPLLHVQLTPLKPPAAPPGPRRDQHNREDSAPREALHTSNTKIYAMLERLDGIFSPFFRIGDRAFTCSSQMAVTDDIGHYMMTMAFTDTVPFEVPEPVGTKLEVDWRNRDGITGDHHQLPAEG